MILPSNATAPGADTGSQRADVIYDVAFELFVISNNRRPNSEEVAAICQTIGTKLNPIPTGRLLEVLDAATVFSAPHAPRVTDMLAVWKQEQANAPRATFGDIERRDIAEGRAIDPETVPRSIPLAVQIHKKLGRCVVCDCEPEKRRRFNDFIEVPRAAKLDMPRAGMRPFWRCATNSCDFAVDAEDENAVRTASVEPFSSVAVGGVAPQTSAEKSDTPTHPTAPLKEVDPELKFSFFVMGCGFDKNDLEEGDLTNMRAFFEWTQGQTPKVIPSRKTFADLWEKWQYDIGVVAA